MAPFSVICLKFSVSLWLVRFLTVPVTCAIRGLPSLITETLIIPRFLLRACSTDLAMSGVRNVELKVL
ncbi:hypothetical protein D3C85_1635630 [compost metagenome]